MLGSNRLKQAFIADKGPSMGLWQMLPGANLARILARSGVDWIMVDCEHGNIDGTLMRAVLGREDRAWLTMGWWCQMNRG